MKWIDEICQAIEYIEAHLTDELTVNEIAKNAYLSPFYFQKGFAMLCGMTVNDYVKMRRLSLAGIELISSEDRIIDIAMKYGYESPDSFTKAFLRFHGVTPSAVRKEGAMIKSFAPLKLKFSLEGGFLMDYKVVEKESFKMVGDVKTFQYESAFAEIPKFWNQHFSEGNGQYICGMFGMSMDQDMKSDCFEYMIADLYDEHKQLPDRFVIKEIPARTWAIFPCVGAMPHALQDVNHKIFTEWLPNCKEYEIADGLNIEMYSDASQFPKGTQDEAYYSEIWIPVKKK